VLSRVVPFWLRRWLADPAATIRASPDLQTWPATYSNIVMPNQNLSTQEIDALVHYLGGLRRSSISGDSGAAEQSAFQQYLESGTRFDAAKAQKELR
jgi:hypothetical protein